jgi:hypothetical protein
MYSSHNIVRVTKSRMRWVKHMGDRTAIYRVLVGKPEGRNHLEDPGADGRILLR